MEPEPPLKKPKMSTTTSDEETTAKPRRYKCRKIAIFFAYCGVGYQGMQKNPGAKTIESDFEEALYLSGAVSESDRGQSKRYDWARSARTDKGVSAVGQVVSGRFYVDPPGFIQRLNSNLSPQIRVFGYKRVTPSFNAKKFCDRRRYVYLLPVFALDSSCHRDRESVLASLGSDFELVKCVGCSERGRKVLGLMGNRKDQDFRRFGPAGVSSNCGGGMLVGGENEEENGNGKGGDVSMKTDVGVVDSEVLGQSGVSSSLISGNEMEKSEEKDCNVFVEAKDSVGDSLKGDVDVGMVDSEVCVGSGVLSKSEDASLISNEKKDCNVSVEDKDGVEEACLLADVSMVDSEVCVDSGLLAKSEAELLTWEVKEEELNVTSDDNGVTGLTSESEVKVEEERKENKSDFKYGEEERKRFNRILKYYVGTHNFHNFTTRTKAEDPSAKRYIVSFEANTTFTIEGIEFVKCEVIGQSFMLHQIRKMMGLAVAVMRNFTPESIYERAFDQDFRINVPTAPEVGLYLDECFFTSYNNKWKNTHEELSMKDYADEAEEFKMKYIYSHVGKAELKEGSVAVWLHSLNHRNYPDLRLSNSNDEVEKVADNEAKEAAKDEVERAEVKEAAKDEVESAGVKEAAKDEVESAEVKEAAKDEGERAAKAEADIATDDQVKGVAEGD